MPITELDISWGMVRQVVQEWAGSSAELKEFCSLDGGSVSSTLKVTLADERQVVIKITPHRVDRAYEDEAHQLDALRQTGVRTPEVYAVHTGSLDLPYSYLVMEYVPGVDLASAKGRCSPDDFDALQRELAEWMLKIHSAIGAGFTRVSRRQMPIFSTWHACYRDIFDPIWCDVSKTNALPIKQRKMVGKLHDRLDRHLISDTTPRLLHWDLWSTNLLAAPNEFGQWHLTAILDPNCKYGCPEAELAYLDLFHTATAVFFKTYQAQRRLDPEYHRVRKPIYQLYSLINHVRLFGSGYAKALCAQAEKVSAFV